MFKIFIFSCICAVLSIALKQKDSPCPGIFEYKNKSLKEGKWIGSAHLTTDEDLQGVWLRVILDAPANLLINWFGQSTSKDNKEFTIMNPAQKLKVGSSVPVLFQVSYNVIDIPPNLIGLRLNGKNICGKNQPLSINILNSSVSQITKSHFPPRFTTQRSTKSEENLHFIGDLNLVTERNSMKFTQPSILFSEEVQCGQIVETVIPLITKGIPAQEGTWPWHIAIYESNGVHSNYICGGSLLDKLHVITAAHCVTKLRTSIVNDPDTYTIHLGRSNLKIFNEGAQERRIAAIFVHPDFNATRYNHDLAILKLSEEVTYTDYVRPICLWSQGEMVSVVGRIGTVVGWGFDDEHHVQDQLHEVKMPVVSTLSCIFSAPNVFNRFTSETTLCAGFRNGTSVCNGDSGGGMFFPQNENSRTTTIWEIRALVSVSLTLQGKYCNPFNYVVFTDLAYHIDWIKEKLRE